MIQMYHPDLIDSAGDFIQFLAGDSDAERIILFKSTTHRMKPLPPVPALLFIAVRSLTRSGYLMKIILPTWRILILDTVRGFTASKTNTVLTHWSIMSEAVPAVPNIILLK